jgi:hypothetical protein
LLCGQKIRLDRVVEHAVTGGDRGFLADLLSLPIAGAARQSSIVDRTISADAVGWQQHIGLCSPRDSGPRQRLHR